MTRDESIGRARKKHFEKVRFDYALKHGPCLACGATGHHADIVISGNEYNQIVQGKIDDGMSASQAVRETPAAKKCPAAK